MDCYRPYPTALTSRKPARAAIGRRSTVRRLSPYMPSRILRAGKRSRSGAGWMRELPNRRSAATRFPSPGGPPWWPRASEGRWAGRRALGLSPWLALAAPVSLPAAIASSRLRASTFAHILSLTPATFPPPPPPHSVLFLRSVRTSVSLALFSGSGVSELPVGLWVLFFKKKNIFFF